MRGLKPTPRQAVAAARTAGGLMRREAARKAIHLSSAIIPLLVWVLPRAVAVLLLVPIAILAVGVDSARMRMRAFRYVFLRYTRTMLRHHERHGFAGATWMVIAYAAVLLLFPKAIAVTAMLFNGLGDAAAALVGKRWGRHRTAWGKSWEGFAAGLAVNLGVAVVISLLDGGLPLIAGLFGAVAAASIEFADLPLDDNLRVTMGGALAIALAAAVLGIAGTV
ncbi:MAG TPA: SEC59/DGK1/VTE5 family protein [Longimicrobium sp.]|nr:SEC59/DGK1/VTE5 family protein [Longimicrobium sp.]